MIGPRKEEWDQEGEKDISSAATTNTAPFPDLIHKWRVLHLSFLGQIKMSTSEAWNGSNDYLQSLALGNQYPEAYYSSATSKLCLVLLIFPIAFALRKAGSLFSKKALVKDHTHFSLVSQ